MSKLLLVSLAVFTFVFCTLSIHFFFFNRINFIGNLEGSIDSSNRMDTLLEEDHPSCAIDSFLDILPPGFLLFEDFEKKFRLGETSTEQLHPLTKALSQTMHKQIVDGLEMRGSTLHRYWTTSYCWIYAFTSSNFSRSGSWIVIRNCTLLK